MARISFKKGNKGWLIILGIFLLSIGIETAFGLQYYLKNGPILSGNDPYYHARIVKTLITEGRYIKYDPLLGYPLIKNNPRPPFYEILGAVASYIIYAITGDLDWSVYVGISIVTVVSAALLAVAAYLLATEIFDNRKVGYIAGLFAALSPSLAERSAFGFADWDPLIMFLGIMAYWAFVRAVKSVKGKVVPEKSFEIRNLRHVTLIIKNKSFLKYSILTGVFLGLISISWQGYPMVFAPIAFYLTVSGFIALITKRDISAEWLAAMVSYFIPIIIAYPVYFHVMAPQPTTWKYSILMFAYVTLVGFVLLYFRDWPYILSYPILAVAGVAGVVLIKTMFPQYWNAVVTGLGYFVKTKLYSTIAEAQPPAISRLMAGVGLAIDVAFAFTYVWLIIEYYLKRDWKTLFILVVSTMYMYIAIKAARFIFNFAPFVAIVGSYGIYKFYQKFVDIDSWIDVIKYSRGIRKVYSAVVSKEVGAIVLAIMIVFPSVQFTVDASIPYELKDKIDPSGKWLGAFGTSFTPPHWVSALEWLSQQDSELPISERPAVIAWWDYGFWIVELGKHPTVADNFQNNYFPAARFITARNETAAILVLTGLVMKAVDENRKPILSEDERINIIMNTLGVNETKAREIYSALLSYSYYPMSVEDAAKLYSAFRNATGRFIAYFIANERMLPWDIPFTPYIDHPGILGAPIYLADYNTDDFYEVIYNTNVGRLNATEYSERVSQGERINIISQSLEYKDPFFETMFYRAYVGIRSQMLYMSGYIARPGYGLKHFVPVYMNSGIRILKYYDGALVSGYVFDENGNPVKNATVAVVVNVTPEGLSPRYVVLDNTETKEDGYYQLIAPAGNITIAVIYGEPGNEKFVGSVNITITEEQAYRKANWIIKNINITVKPVRVQGYLYFDKNINGKYDPYTDPLAGNGTIEVEGVGTFEFVDGYFNITVLPGNREIRIMADGFELHTITRGFGEEPITMNISLTPKKVDVSLRLWFDANNNGVIDPGEIVQNGTVNLIATHKPGNFGKTTAVMIRDGYGNATINPGEYYIHATFDLNGTKVSTIALLEAPLGSNETNVTVELQRGYDVSIHVLMENGTVASDATVIIRPVDKDFIWESELTNAQGYVNITLPPGEYILYAHEKVDNVTYVDYTIFIVTESTTVEMVLKEGYMVTGAIWNDTNGNGTIEDTEEIMGVVVALSTDLGTLYITLSEVNGNYSLPVLPGDYTIKVYFLDYGKLSEKIVNVHVEGSYNLNIEIP